MKTWLSFVVAALFVLSTKIGAGELPVCPKCHARMECGLQEIVTQRCVLVPEVKQIKKTIYECKQVPFCTHGGRLGHAGHDKGTCPTCEACPRYKTVLIKREIVVGEVCSTKCVVEDVVECVPVHCCHCGHQACTGQKLAQPAAPMSAPFAPPLPVLIEPAR